MVGVRGLCEFQELANATLLTVGLILTLREAAQLILETLPSIRGQYEVIASAPLSELARTEKAVLFGIRVPPWRCRRTDVQRSSDVP